MLCRDSVCVLQVDEIYSVPDVGTVVGGTLYRQVILSSDDNTSSKVILFFILILVPIGFVSVLLFFRFRVIVVTECQICDDRTPFIRDAY